MEDFTCWFAAAGSCPLQRILLMNKSQKYKVLLIAFQAVINNLFLLPSMISIFATKVRIRSFPQK